MKTLTLKQAEEIMRQNNGNLDLSNTSIKKLPDNLTVGGNLYLYNTSIKKLPDNLNVGGNLDLHNTPIKKLPDNLTVGGYLYLSNTHIEELPDNLTVGSGLNLHDTPIKKLPDNLTVGGDLNLHDTPIKQLPDNLNVGGDLYLSNTSIKQLPDNLTVGDGLYLSNTSIKKLPDSLKVGYNIYHHKIQFTNYNKLENGDYVPGRYLYADNILTYIKRERKAGPYTYYQGKIKNNNVIYDGKNYAHCTSIRDGISELLFKSMSDRGSDQYKGLSLDTVMNIDELKTMYRIITGACKQGTEQFISNIKDIKDSYTIREAIELTRGQYGSEIFERFFEVETE